MVSSDVAMQEQSGSTESNGILPTVNQNILDINPNCVKDAQLNDKFPTESAYAPKVRKPYTITKQRERWTEQEHEKFIEALKLYGRAWRKIEDHVGTKTAVQIRSHAQKFFTKVVRESTEVTSVKPIEIPPPRPKRKPMHPYPRKVSDPIKIGSSAADQSPRTKFPHYSEQDNCSPTSVLSAVCSDTLGATDSDSPNGSESPDSSDADASPEDTGSPVPLQLTASSTAADEEVQVPVKLELFTTDTDLVEEGPAEAAFVHSLKLFGKTVIVGDSQKPSSPTTGTCNSSLNSDQKHGPTLPMNLMPTRYPSLENSWNSMQGAPSPFYCMQLSSEASNASDSGSGGPPMWAFYGGLQYPLFQMPSPALFPSIPLHNGVSAEAYPSSVSGQTTDCVLQKEGSLTDSNTVSVNVGGDGNSQTANSVPQRTNPVRIQKGFVPYKRCLAERDSMSSARTGDEREEQRVRLCL